MQPHPRVLLLGENGRATLACARSLGRHGVIVEIAAHRDGPACHSRFVSAVHKTPDERTREYALAIRNLVERTKYDLVIPTTESTFVPIMDARAEIENAARCALPSSESFSISADKHAVAELARSLNIPNPDAVLLSSVAELETFKTEDMYPKVVKPVRSRVKTQNGYQGLSVAIAHNQTDLQRAARDRLAYGPVLVQGFVSGVGVGQEFLAEKGDILEGFEHRRLREHEGSGGSTDRISAALHPGMLAASRALVKQLNWTGVLMIEYRFDESHNAFSLIEINGRFWGSLALPVACGIDFPYDLYELLADGRRPEPRTYRAGIRMRDVFADLTHYARKHGLIATAARGIASTTALLFWQEQWDIFALDDQKPFWFEVVRLAKKSLHRSTNKRTSGALLNARDQARAAHRILFVCYGNINRSAFAEHYARKQFSERGIRGVEIRSRGLIDQSGRPSPALAQDIASSFGISLADHRSGTIEQDDIDWADVIFFMDSMNARALAERFPVARTKAHYLAEVSGTRSDIIDPDGMTEPGMRAVFSKIAKEIDALAEIYMQAAIS